MHYGGGAMVALGRGESREGARGERDVRSRVVRLDLGFVKGERRASGLPYSPWEDGRWPARVHRLQRRRWMSAMPTPASVAGDGGASGVWVGPKLLCGH